MEHGNSVIQELEKLKQYQKLLPHIGHEILSADTAKLYSLDFVVIGIVKRCLSLSSAFSSQVESWNMVAARAMLRMQVDSAIRLSAFWLVDNPHEMASRVIGGEQINQMKDKNGKTMRDAYLVEQMSGEYEWMPRVYKYTSGYIHFSEKHLFDPVTKTDDKTKQVKFLISEFDHKYPESSWYEIAACFNNCTEIVLSYLTGYELAKKGRANNS